MALDFPPSSAGTYVDPVSGLKYIYNTGVGAWEAAIQPPAVVSDAAPAITIPGFLWWDSTDGSLYVYYKDADSEQWVEAVPSGAASSIARVGVQPPSNPNDGELWWSSAKGNLYIYYNDGNSSQWIQATTYNAPTAVTAGTKVTAGVTAPQDYKTHDLWYNTTDKTLYIHHDSTWKKIHDIEHTDAVTEVTATLPVVATSGTTPVISVNEATVTSSGVVTLAAVLDSTNGSQSHVLTPKVLKESISSYFVDASTTEKGLIQLATQVELIDGKIIDKAVSPKVLKDSLDSLTVNIPIGGIIQFGGTVPPTGYLQCDGSLVSRTTYAALFQVIGVNYGIGDGSTTFKLPDISGTTISCIKF